MAEHVTTSYTCDNCRADIVHHTKDNVVEVKIDGEVLHTDWCDDCRAALKAKLVPTELTCTTCGYVAKSERGLNMHKARKGH